MFDFNFRVKRFSWRNFYWGYFSGGQFTENIRQERFVAQFTYFEIDHIMLIIK